MERTTWVICIFHMFCVIARSFQRRSNLLWGIASPDAGLAMTVQLREPRQLFCLVHDLLESAKVLYLMRLKREPSLQEKPKADESIFNSADRVRKSEELCEQLEFVIAAVFVDDAHEYFAEFVAALLDAEFVARGEPFIGVHKVSYLYAARAADVTIIAACAEPDVGAFQDLFSHSGAGHGDEPARSVRH